MSDECLFCKIFNNEIPSQKVYESENVTGFLDISPLAKLHVLFIHKEHSKNINEMAPLHIQEVFTAIKDYTKKEGLEENGFRVVTNYGDFGGQTVFHTHFHVLGMEKLRSFGA